MAFPQAPYYISVNKAQINSIDIVGVQYRLENLTKVTEVLRASVEVDSNITINIAECGDWNINDDMKITASYYGKLVTSTHQITAGDNNMHDFGILELTDPVAGGGGALINGGLVQ